MNSSINEAVALVLAVATLLEFVVVAAVVTVTVTVTWGNWGMGCWSGLHKKLFIDFKLLDIRFLSIYNWSDKWAVN